MSNADPTSPPVPVHLEKTDDRCLVIQWSDDRKQTIPFRKLRDNCRCAGCIDKRMEALNENATGEKKLANALPVLSAAETMPLDIILMHPVGNYAYNIHFSDGHMQEYLRSSYCDHWMIDRLWQI